jgi:hypothetical protein
MTWPPGGIVVVVRTAESLDPYCLFNFPGPGAEHAQKEHHVQVTVEMAGQIRTLIREIRPGSRVLEPGKGVERLNSYSDKVMH